MSENEKRGHGRRNLVIAGIVAIVVIILLLLRGCGSGNPIPGPTPSHNLNPGGGTVSVEDLDKKTPEEIQEELDRAAAKGYITISMNSKPVFKTGASEGNLSIANAVNVWKLQLDDGEVTTVEGNDTRFELTVGSHAYEFPTDELDFIREGKDMAFDSTDGEAKLTFRKTTAEGGDAAYTYSTTDGQTGTYKYYHEPGNYYSQVVEIYKGRPVKDAETGEDGYAYDELIYTSPVVAVGSFVHTDRLAVDLDAGEYPCLACFYNVVENDDGSVTSIGQGNAEILLTVEG